MKSAKDLKSQAIAAKRAATSITTLVTSIERQRVLDSAKAPLTIKELEQLEAATRILRVFGKQATSSAKKVAQQEAAAASAIEKATKEAEQIIAKWPTDKMIDKVALIIGNRIYSESNVRLKLEDALEGSAHVESWFEDAVLEIPMRAAYRAVKVGKPIEQVMAEAAAKLENIKARPSVQAMIAEWMDRMK